MRVMKNSKQIGNLESQRISSKGVDMYHPGNRFSALSSLASEEDEFATEKESSPQDPVSSPTIEGAEDTDDKVSETAASVCLCVAVYGFVSVVLGVGRNILGSVLVARLVDLDPFDKTWWTSLRLDMFVVVGEDRSGFWRRRDGGDGGAAGHRYKADDTFDGVDGGRRWRLCSAVGGRRSAIEVVFGGNQIQMVFGENQIQQIWR
ncbi:hypothetical protein U1Q18_003453 [Sarracenia purpurea var. burkii]